MSLHTAIYPPTVVPNSRPTREYQQKGNAMTTTTAATAPLTDPCRPWCAGDCDPADLDAPCRVVLGSVTREYGEPVTVELFHVRDGGKFVESHPAEIYCDDTPLTPAEALTLAGLLVEAGLVL